MTHSQFNHDSPQLNHDSHLILAHQVVLCFSPVGNTLRVRSRKFPAITNCTSINWFHEWPEVALLSVSRRFLEEVDLLSVYSTLLICRVPIQIFDKISTIIYIIYTYFINIFYIFHINFYKKCYIYFIVYFIVYNLSMTPTH